MLLVISALLPVFMVIVLGYLLRSRGVLDAPAWHGLEDLCYYVLFPVLLVKTLAVADVNPADVARYSGALLFAICAMTGHSFTADTTAMRRWWKKNRKKVPDRLEGKKGEKKKDQRSKGSEDWKGTGARRLPSVGASTAAFEAAEGRPRLIL